MCLVPQSPRTSPHGPCSTFSQSPRGLGSRALKTRTMTLAQGPTGPTPGLLSETKCQGEMETSVPDPVATSPSVWSGRPVRESNSFVGRRALWPNERAPLLPRSGQSRARCQESQALTRAGTQRCFVNGQGLKIRVLLRVLRGPELTFLSYHLASGALLLTCSSGRAPPLPPTLPGLPSEDLRSV